MGLFFLLQLLLGSVERAGGSDSVYPSDRTWIFRRRSAAIQIFMDSNFMTMLTVVSTFAMAVFSVPAYCAGLGQEKDSAGQS